MCALDRRARRGLRRGGGRTRDDGGVPPRGPSGRGDRLHRIPEHREDRHRFFALFGSGATFRHISVGSREGLQDVARAIAMAGIKPVIDRVFDFERAKEAFAHLESGSHFGKVVIRCSAPAADAGNKS